MYLETFEEGLLNTLGVTASTGSVVGPGGNTNSVDCDDGLIDGSGTNGRSFFSGNGPGGITFTFNATTLGGFPTEAGIVWTDGGFGASVTFEAFDATVASLGSVVAPNAGDNSNNGTTAEDLFFGVTNAGGISAIHISNSSGGIDVDHLQYGPYASVVGALNPVPLINQPLVPTSAAPGGAALTLTVNGTGFVQGATLNWNGSPRPTNFVNGSQLTASISAADIASVGTAPITVVNPTPGGGTSNVLFFTVIPSSAFPTYASSSPINLEALMPLVWEISTAMESRTLQSRTL